MEFALPTRAAARDATPAENPENPAHPSTDAPPASAAAKPRRKRRRKDETSDLLAAYKDHQNRGEELEAKLRKRTCTLESECYMALGAAVFALREHDQIAAAYQSITAPLPIQMKKMLDDLVKLADLEV